MGQAFWDILNVFARMFPPGYFHCVGSVLALCRAVSMMFLLELRAVILAAVVWDC